MVGFKTIDNDNSVVEDDEGDGDEDGEGGEEDEEDEEEEERTTEFELSCFAGFMNKHECDR